MGPTRQPEDVECLLQPGLVLQEIGVGREAEPQRGSRGRVRRDGICDPAKMRALGCVSGEIREMTPNRRELPGKALLRFYALESGQQAIHQAGDNVGTQREARREVPAVLTLDPRTLEKRRVRQNIRRGAELIEQLLGRIQVAIPALGGESS
jgi:ribosomal protein L29